MGLASHDIIRVNPDLAWDMVWTHLYEQDV